MRVGTLSIGDELLSGETLDSNSQRLARAIAAREWTHTGHAIVGDDPEAIAAAVRSLGEGSDLVLTSGGLGPTLDDLTREALALVVGDPLALDEAIAESIEALFTSRGLKMPESNRRQAMRPPSAMSIPNANGTAPGLRVGCGSYEVLALPGPPRELLPMLASALPEVDRAPRQIVVVACGIGESAAAERIQEFMDRDAEPIVGITVSGCILRARIRARDHATTAAEVERVGATVREQWAPWAIDQETLPAAIAEVLRGASGTLAVAESCTGGMIQTMLTDLAGSSAWFRGGWVTYSNEMKCDHLGVSAEVIERDGAVSASVAEAMAAGARDRAGATLAVSTTGIAGPIGGSRAKPVGAVYIGVADDAGATARLFHFPGDRQSVRRRTSQTALQLVRFRALGLDQPLLFEVRS